MTESVPEEPATVDLVIADREGSHRLHSRGQPLLMLPDGEFAMDVDGRVRKVALLTLGCFAALGGPLSFAYLDERLEEASAPAREPGLATLPAGAPRPASWDLVERHIAEDGESFGIPVEALEAWWGPDDEAGDPWPDSGEIRIIRYDRES
ncbi:hypothetical protein [Sabulicella glaciei]|uniref:Uncharacterized protein n=1 Tax=Sabulicella glaciei TaxID=2984948 RepID=A0ABT3P055_9PROT|nr:hypothetical protein [Roseococcus sp. MDT2-1-1]MCW8087798.1 hypothetical protein [Roseococcus sp. MDT2-1-1]